MYESGRILNLPNNWKTMGLNRSYVYTYDTTIKRKEDGVVITCPFSLVADHISNIAEIESVYTIYNSGVVNVALKVHIRENIEYLPRFGMRLFLKKEFNHFIMPKEF